MLTLLCQIPSQLNLNHDNCFAHTKVCSPKLKHMDKTTANWTTNCKLSKNIDKGKKSWKADQIYHKFFNDASNRNTVNLEMYLAMCNLNEWQCIITTQLTVAPFLKHISKYSTIPITLLGIMHVGLEMIHFGIICFICVNLMECTCPSNLKGKFDRLKEDQTNVKSTYVDQHILLVLALFYGLCINKHVINSCLLIKYFVFYEHIWTHLAVITLL